MTEQPPVPTVMTSAICASTKTYSDEPVKSHQYKMVCTACDVKWQSPTIKDDCWSCGQTIIHWLR